MACSAPSINNMIRCAKTSEKWWFISNESLVNNHQLPICQWLEKWWRLFSCVGIIFMILNGLHWESTFLKWSRFSGVLLRWLPESFTLFLTFYQMSSQYSYTLMSRINQVASKWSDKKQFYTFHIPPTTNQKKEKKNTFTLTYWW